MGVSFLLYQPNILNGMVILCIYLELYLAVPRYEILNLDTVEPFGTDTSVLWTVSNKILIYFLKKNFYNNGLSLIRTTNTKSQPQGVNKLNLFITDTAVIR